MILDSEFAIRMNNGINQGHFFFLQARAVMQGERHSGRETNQFEIRNGKITAWYIEWLQNDSPLLDCW